MGVVSGLEGLQYRVLVEKIHKDGKREIVGDTKFVPFEPNISKEDLIFALKILGFLSIDFKL